MSLTRDEWCKMWESVKTIEGVVYNAGNLPRAKIDIIMLREVEKIKQQIQSVIGQME